ncbi:MAG TPA: MBL fold metallo-hydrolase [Thermoanaerobaculia bacterium]|nr:MBL fold metallo-hydrolase [Thermoanaerobaculia bacterium]
MDGQSSKSSDTPPEAPPAADTDLLYAPHGETGRFFNPWAPPFESRITDLLRWKFGGKNPYDKSAPPRVPVVANDGAYLKDRGAPDSVTWVGHSAFAVQDGGEVFLTDPHFGQRALLPKRKSPPGIPLAAVPPDAFAVLSHNHYDHLDAWSVEHLPASMPWFVPLGLAGFLRERGRQAVELDWWQSVRHGRWTLTCLPAQHWSNRFGVARNASLWCSWLLDSGTRRYYFAGDSGYFSGFAEIGRKLAPIDVAFLPIGAYEPRWFMRPQHADPEEAYQAFLDLGARAMIPMHWGCFDLTDEPVDLPPKVLEQVLERRGADRTRVRTMAVGERWTIGPTP